MKTLINLTVLGLEVVAIILVMALVIMFLRDVKAVL